MTQCRTDNGLCFHRIEQPYGATFAYFHFCDGTLYRMEPLKSIELYHIANHVLEAGCWFNRALAKRRGFRYTKLSAVPQLSGSRNLTLDYKGNHQWTITLSPP